jgi:hypothetical protein
MSFSSSTDGNFKASKHSIQEPKTVKSYSTSGSGGNDPMGMV